MPITTVVAGTSALVFAIIERELLANEIVVNGPARSRADLLGQTRALRPDVVVTDTVLSDGAIDQETIAALHSAGARVLLLCDDQEMTLVTTALFAGASGYLLLRDTRPQQLTHAVFAVANGDAVLHPAVAASIIEQWRRDRAEKMATRPAQVELAARELDVLTAMADGLPTKAIASRLGISIKTIESHKSRIFSKLGAKNQAHAVAIALDLHLLPVRSATDDA